MAHAMDQCGSVPELYQPTSIRNGEGMQCDAGDIAKPLDIRKFTTVRLQSYLQLQVPAGDRTVAAGDRRGDPAGDGRPVRPA